MRMSGHKEQRNKQDRTANLAEFVIRFYNMKSNQFQVTAQDMQYLEDAIFMLKTSVSTQPILFQYAIKFLTTENICTVEIMERKAALIAKVFNLLEEKRIAFTYPTSGFNYKAFVSYKQNRIRRANNIETIE